MRKPTAPIGFKRHENSAMASETRAAEGAGRLEPLRTEQ